LGLKGEIRLRRGGPVWPPWEGDAHGMSRAATQDRPYKETAGAYRAAPYRFATSGQLMVFHQAAR
jgi:hypothetical protein